MKKKTDKRTIVRNDKNEQSRIANVRKIYIRVRDDLRVLKDLFDESYLNAVAVGDEEIGYLAYLVGYMNMLHGRAYELRTEDAIELASKEPLLLEFWMDAIKAKREREAKEMGEV